MAYSLAVYAGFLAVFAYAVGFLQRLGVSKDIDDGGPVATGAAVATELALIGLFAIQHSAMARPAFKRRWTRRVPAPIERSTYVLASSLISALDPIDLPAVASPGPKVEALVTPPVMLTLRDGTGRHWIRWPNGRLTRLRLSRRIR